MQPNWVNSGMSPEHVCAPESASVDVSAVFPLKPGGNGRAVGMIEESVRTLMVIVTLGGFLGACLTNFSPSHSMCGKGAATEEREVLHSGSTSIEMFTKM